MSFRHLEWTKNFLAVDFKTLDEEAENVQKRAQNREKSSERALPDKSFLRRRLENEINALYDRLAKSLKEENERLRAENERLEAENSPYKA